MRVIKRHLSPKDRMQSRRCSRWWWWNLRTGAARSYIEIIVTDREQSFVLRGCALTRRLPLPPNVRAALFGALRSLIITITSIFYGANFRSCRGSMSRFSEGSAKKGRHGSQHREGSGLDSPNSPRRIPEPRTLSVLRRAARDSKGKHCRIFLAIIADRI